MPALVGNIRYDRRVASDFLKHFGPGGVASSLVEYALHARYPVDLQLRHSPTTNLDQASLYVGLTRVLVVEAKPHGCLALTAHEKWTHGPFGFDDRSQGLGWQTARPVAEWPRLWSAVEDYLEQVIPAAAAKFGVKEGAVQAAVSAFDGKHRFMLDREVTPHFSSAEVKSKALHDCSWPLVQALNLAKTPAGTVPGSFGSECDLLAVDDKGRLLAVEVKPLAGTSITWSPAQATMYARVFQAWVADDPYVSDEQPGWRGVIDGMLKQRQKLGLVRAVDIQLPAQPRVVPVVALQRGASSKTIGSLWAVQRALIAAGVGDPDFELYHVSLSGRLDRLKES